MAIVTTLLAIGVAISGQIAPLQLILFAMLPFGVAFPFVLGASTVIGLPLTLLFQRRRSGSEPAYMAVGIIAGFILPILVLHSIDSQTGHWVGLFGAVAGGVTARTWWISAIEPLLPYDDCEPA